MPTTLLTPAAMHRGVTQSGRRLTTVALAAALFTAALPALSPASADMSTNVAGIVSEAPTRGTPVFKGTHEGRDMVRAIEPQGDFMAAGGLFDSAKKPGTQEQVVANFSIWRHSTGDLLDAPLFDDEIYSLEPAADGRSWYVGGFFKHVDGVPRRGIVRVDRDGTVDETFAPDVQYGVKDMVLVGDELYVGGSISKINGQTYTGLAILDATTGEPRSWSPELTDAYSTPTTPGSVSVDKLDASEDGTRLVVAGNFARVDGVETGRMAQFDIAGDEPTLLDWSVDGLKIDQCPNDKSAAFITDIDIAPSGDWVIMSATGGWGPPESREYLCDGAARFELGARGNDVRPTWVSPTGGDTISAAQIAGEIVYLGGHQRWLNNPYALDEPAAGAVSRIGIAAVDARNGVPVSWNPGRDPRGFGVYELTVAEDGLWLGHDTGNIGSVFRGFAAHMPNEGGADSMAWRGTGTLPVDVLVSHKNDEADLVRFTGGKSSYGDRIDLSFEKPTGMTGYGDDMLVATDEGELLRVEDGGTGTVHTIDMRGLAPRYFDPEELRGMAYDEQRGELLYVRKDDDTLYARGFTADGWLLAATERVVATSRNIDWERTRSLMLVDGTLYIGDKDDKLGAVSYGVDGPADVRPRQVSGKDIDKIDWSKPAGVRTSAATARGNVAPVAAFDMSCEALTCTVDAGDSEDRFGAIASYHFATSGTAGLTTLDAAHGRLTLPRAGDVTVTLTVTDVDGATDSISHRGVATEPGLGLLGVDHVEGWGTTHTVEVPAGTHDGSLALLTIGVARNGFLPATPDGLDGWTSLGTITAGNSESAVWWAPVGADDIRSDVSITLAGATKAQLSLSTWSGTDLTDPIAAFASATATSETAEHITPTVTTEQATTVVELWSLKSSTSTDWTAPSNSTTVFEDHGLNGGHMSTLLTTRDGAAPGTVGGSTAWSDVTDQSVTLWTIALRAA